MKVGIYLNNNKSQIVGDRALVAEMREEPQFKLRVKGFFFAVRSGNAPAGWDGYKRYITETGLFPTGLLAEILKWLETNKVKVTLVDKRRLFREVCIPDKLGDLKFRGYQHDAVKGLLEHRVEGIRFQRGTLYEATNGGKNLIAAGVFASFHKKRLGMFLIDNTEIFPQAVEELRELLGDDVGEVSRKKTDWRRLNVCMVQTLANRIKTHPKIKADVQNTDILLVDESDQVLARKDTQTILTTAYDAPVRVALTGSFGTSKDKIRNRDSVAIIGPVIHTISNKDLVDAGHSAKPYITFSTGNNKIRYDKDYPREMEEGIIQSKQRNKKIWKRVTKHLKKGRTSIMILYQYHRHAKYIMEYIPEWIREEYKIGIVNHKTGNRAELIQKFKDGKINILLCSMIIKRGKNLPLMEVLVNAAGGDSWTNIKQIFGRALRKKKGGKVNKVWVEEFYDTGKYLQRHSKHRILYYKKEGFPVKELYKKSKS